ncbi:hypothetical protein [uncultured Muribaculum sp.]|uniref:hypothetical protein n=1 Tax=uncultured Muribaculum sp. TaxID=1918613 RepID=UPI0025DD99B9|nr:hypothetical protein [uncultured Muribaculum sp.]
MTKFKSVISTLGLLCMASVSAQTIDTRALAEFSPAVVRQAFDVCRYVKLSEAQQVKLAKAIEKENEFFMRTVGENDGVLTVKGRNRLAGMRENTLSSLLDENQLRQYWRGVYNADAMAEGAAIADKLQKKYGLTDQNWKFINVAFYKIALDTRMLKKVMADQPKKASKMIADLREEQLKCIEEKGGIRVNPDDMTITRVRDFEPEALRKQ